HSNDKRRSLQPISSQSNHPRAVLQRELASLALPPSAPLQLLCQKPCLGELSGPESCERGYKWVEEKLSSLCRFFSFSLSGPLKRFSPFSRTRRRACNTNDFPVCILSVVDIPWFASENKNQGRGNS